MTRPSIGDVRQFWDARPCNVFHSKAPIGSLQYHKEVTARKYLVEPHIPAFIDFSTWKGKRVLDAGCGIGTMALSLAEAGAEVTAVDLSERSLDVARRRAASAGLFVEFLQGNLENLRAFVPPGAFDLVLAFGVLHHTPRPRRAVEQLMTYMHEGSVLKAMIYHRRSLKVLGTRLRGERVTEHSEAQARCPIAETYNKEEARALFSRFDVELEVAHIFPYRVKDYIKGRHVWHWYWKTMPRGLFRWLERHFGWHLLVTGRLT